MKTRFNLIQLLLTLVVASINFVGATIQAQLEITVSPTGVGGVLNLTQTSENDPVRIVGRLTGLQPAGKHGFHIHDSGNLTVGCDSTGPHYNPKNVNHGAPDASVRHVGDLGNIIADAQGVVNVDITDLIIKLSGNESVLGRAFVIHATIDDLGLGGNSTSLANGNSGPRVACGVISEIPNKSNQLRINQLLMATFALIFVMTIFY